MTSNYSDKVFELVSRFGSWACGDNAELAAKEWEETNLDVGLMEEFLNAGVFSASAAKELMDNGVEPSSILDKRIEGVQIGYIFANNDMSIEEIKKY